MTELFLSLIPVSMIMAAVAALLLLLSKLSGNRFTAKCRYLVWTLVLLRLCIPFGAALLPSVFTVEFPSEMQIPVPSAVPDSGFHTTGNAPSQSNVEIPASTTVVNIGTNTDGTSSNPMQSEPAGDGAVHTEAPQGQTPFVFDVNAAIMILSCLWLCGAILCFAWKLTACNLSSAAILRLTGGAGGRYRAVSQVVPALRHPPRTEAMCQREGVKSDAVRLL